MLWVKVIASLVLIIFGAAASLWGIGRLTARLAKGWFWLATLLTALIGALPELWIGLLANAKGLGLVAFGTPLGSSAINMLLLGGLAATISPTRAYEPFPTKATWGVAAAALLLMVVAYVGRWLSPLGVYTVSRWGGVVLCGAFAGFIFFASTTATADSGAPRQNSKLLWPIVFLAVGIALVACGAALAASAATAHIVATGCSQNAIGIIWLALMAALPEATAVIFLAKRRQTAAAFADLMHSSATNLLLIIGIVALVGAIPAYEALPIDLGIILLGALMVLATVALGKGRRVSRGEGIALIAGYLLFAIFVLLRQDSNANLFF